MLKPILKYFTSESKLIKKTITPNYVFEFFKKNQNKRRLKYIFKLSNVYIDIQNKKSKIFNFLGNKKIKGILLKREDS